MVSKKMTAFLLASMVSPCLAFIQLDYAHIIQTNPSLPMERVAEIVEKKYRNNLQQSIPVSSVPVRLAPGINEENLSIETFFEELSTLRNPSVDAILGKYKPFFQGAAKESQTDRVAETAPSGSTPPPPPPMPTGQRVLPPAPPPPPGLPLNGVKSNKGQLSLQDQLKNRVQQRQDNNENPNLPPPPPPQPAPLGKPLTIVEQIKSGQGRRALKERSVFENAIKRIPDSEIEPLTFDNDYINDLVRKLRVDKTDYGLTNQVINEIAQEANELGDIDTDKKKTIRGMVINRSTKKFSDFETKININLGIVERARFKKPTNKAPVKKHTTADNEAK